MSTAIVVGGGFYGAVIAAYLKSERGFGQVTLLEAADRLLSRASYVNQARVHHGYHYPRSFTTAYRSRVNYPRFLTQFSEAVVALEAIYAVARRNSKITPRQMERFCADVGAELAPAPEEVADLFDPRTVAAVYRAEESAFHADKLRALCERLLPEAGVEVRVRTAAQAVDETSDGVIVHAGGTAIAADLVLNCTYSALQSLQPHGSAVLDLKHELTELALIRAPAALQGLGVTVMDGPFFSAMPFPARGLHSLTHVRYTPHMSWPETGARDPQAVLGGYAGETRVDRMLRDASRYLPCLGKAEVEGSLFEVKTVLARNETDDGRPILFARSAPNGRVISILGGKIDNVFDVLARLDQEALP